MLKEAQATLDDNVLEDGSGRNFNGPLRCWIYVDGEREAAKKEKK